ncbi:MAG: phosphatidylserine decarboxylase [Nanoarchaeota archaeon]|nr:phosphatidylserine decarboxylase [Nanoarchaeota archaeon]MBU1004607.1 phosphatidylserine decarboxylase [Nanoarchaeota archaeon]MBU1945529.1 phosphatidylserine decarboxylase [Nanoarchaeota archaeon]
MVVLGILIVFASVILLFLLFYLFIFLRDPERGVPIGDNIVAPADGKVIKVIKLENISEMKIEKGVLGKIKTLVSDTCKEGYLITIMMDIFNVHVQRAPVEGKVISTKYVNGSFKNAVYGDKFENGLLNEKNEIIIENRKIGKIKVIQIAGIVARRIVCFVRKNQKINKGQKIGMIKFGSQVCVIFPDKVKLSVKEGDNVKAGETVLGMI